MGLSNAASTNSAVVPGPLSDTYRTFQAVSRSNFLRTSLLRGYWKASGVALRPEAVIVPAVTKGTADRGGVETKNQCLLRRSVRKGAAQAPR